MGTRKRNYLPVLVLEAARRLFAVGRWCPVNQSRGTTSVTNGVKAACLGSITQVHQPTAARSCSSAPQSRA